jgi:hypothetical protein
MWTAFPSAIAAEQARTKATADAVNTSLTSCTSLDATTQSEWQTFYASVTDFCGKTPVIFPWPWESNYVLALTDTASTLKAYQVELEAWQKRLTGLNCSAPVPLLGDQYPQTASSYQPFVDIAKYGAIIACAVGGAWVVSEVVSAVRGIEKIVPAKPKER